MRKRVWAADAAYAHDVDNETAMPVVNSCSTSKAVRREMVVDLQPTIDPSESYGYTGHTESAVATLVWRAVDLSLIHI